MSEATEPIRKKNNDTPYPRVHDSADPDGRGVAFGDVVFGAEAFVVIAGPCAVETEEQIEATAASVADSGALVLRGGAFKPRTSPYSFQGLGIEGVELLRRASLRSGIPFVTEVMSIEAVAELAPRVDAFQIGTRNMHNFELLRAVGGSEKPVLLKRGFGSTLREWLLAAEYVAQGGNDQIVLCERGIRTFAQETRYTLDLAGALWAQQESCLPVIVDPSHATGSPELIAPLCRAAVAAGLDGVMVEVHDAPASALSDGEQALTGEDFRRLMEALRPIAGAAGRRLARADRDADE